MPWLSCFIGGVYRENHRPAASLTNFIRNGVSSNKGVLIADIYIRTTVYINLKNIPPREPRGIEIGPSFSAEGYNPPPQKSQLGVYNSDQECKGHMTYCSQSFDNNKPEDHDKLYLEFKAVLTMRTGPLAQDQ
jgi:hypothetical protein